MKRIAFYSIKGGVGKTATCVNLAYLASLEGHSTLISDLDPQGSASYYFRVRTKKKFKSRHLVAKPKKVDANIRASDYENLDILPSNITYRKLDLLMDDMKKSKKVLNTVFKPYEKDYDCLFWDCPPNITLLSENIFYSADLILVPVIPTTLSMLTYVTLIDFFDKKDLDRSKIVPFFSMVEIRKSLHRDIMEETIHSDSAFLKSYIPYSSDIEKMGIHREPVLCFKKTSKASKAYNELWKEIKDYL